MPIPRHQLCRHRVHGLLLVTKVTGVGEADVLFTSLKDAKVVAFVSLLSERAKAELVGSR